MSSRATEIAEVNIPFVNYHAGITPKYRGVHGGYWAKAEDDLRNFGVTAHLIDAGIDTGAVLYQARIAPTARDNFSTYPYLQMAAALPLLEQAARDAMAGTLKPQPVDLPSRAWSHPIARAMVAPRRSGSRTTSTRDSPGAAAATAAHRRGSRRAGSRGPGGRSERWASSRQSPSSRSVRANRALHERGR